LLFLQIVYKVWSFFVFFSGSNYYVLGMLKFSNLSAVWLISVQKEKNPFVGIGDCLELLAILASYDW
jgi:hypothetical protein